MKCPKCGQGMIDIKDYCVNCGAKIREEKKGISLGGLFLILLTIMIISVLNCNLIANYNKEEEIKPYIASEKENVKESKRV